MAETFRFRRLNGECQVFVDGKWRPLGGDGSGEPGLAGPPGEDGADGREVELQIQSANLQWRRVGDLSWTNLVSLSAITGSPGLPGADGSPGVDGAPGADGANGLGFVARALKTADQTDIGTALADITDLALAVDANKAYAFEYGLIMDADAATTGIDVSLNGPASPTSINYEIAYWTSATARTERPFSAYNVNTASTGSNGATRALFRIRGVIRNGANAGNLVPRAKRENVGTGPNCRAGSYGYLIALD